mgnify:CR=1 FL=1
MRRFTHRKKKIQLTQNNKSRRKVWLWIGIFFVLILAAAFLTVFKLGLFNIKNIEVEMRGNLDCANDTALKEATLLYGRNLLFIDREHIEKNIKEKFICIQDVSLTKSLLSRVKINVSGREGAAAIFSLKTKEATSSAFLENIATPSAEEAGEILLVDKEGVVFSKSVGDLNMPKIFLYDPNLGLGQRADKETQSSLWILEKLKILGFDGLTTQILENLFLIHPTTLSPKIIFRLDGEVDAQIASLQLILEKAKINAESLEFVDLRFDKPIIRFAPKKK